MYNGWPAHHHHGLGIVGATSHRENERAGG